LHTSANQLDATLRAPPPPPPPKAPPPSGIPRSACPAARSMPRQRAFTSKRLRPRTSGLGTPAPCIPALEGVDWEVGGRIAPAPRH
jgi:hypothetical protein